MRISDWSSDVCSSDLTVFKDLGQPNAYVAGREGGGAIGIGVRYGEGKLYHKVEGEMPIYWRGPSIGFDVGADGSKTFTLIRSEERRVGEECDSACRRRGAPYH